MTSPRLIGDALDKVFKSSRRGSLNDNPHFVPINLEIARMTLTSVLRKAGDELDDPGLVSNVDNIIDGIKKYVEKKHANKLYLQSLPEDYYSNPSKYLPAVVYSKGDLVGALYGTYSKAYSGLFKDYLNKEVYKYLSSSRYEKNLQERQQALDAEGKGKMAGEYKVGYDVGHLIYSEKSYTVSPAYAKLEDSLKTIEDMLNGNTSVLDTEIPSGLIAKHKTDLQNLKSAVQAELNTLKERSVYGQQISVELEKVADLDNFLVSSKAVVVIVQDRLENQYFYGTQLEGKIVKAVADLLATVNYSKNIVEELEVGFLNALTGKKNSKKKVSKKLPDLKIKPNNLNNKITSGPKTGVQRKAPKSTIVPRDPQLDLFSLTNYINANLASRIQANMGTGSSKNVLNYRSGRFAETVNVERLSQSREGMITAFYSYMKNPYATFSEGGAQQYPKTRDPKLLISKSIRELAADKVANRLRAVVV